MTPFGFITTEIGVTVGRTSDPDIYAAGDCLENWDIMTSSKTRRLMVTTAGRTGNVAGGNLVKGNSIPYEGTLNELSLAIAEKVPLHRLALLETPYSPAVGRDPIVDGVMRLIRKLG